MYFCCCCTLWLCSRALISALEVLSNTVKNRTCGSWGLAMKAWVLPDGTSCEHKRKNDVFLVIRSTAQESHDARVALAADWSGHLRRHAVKFGGAVYVFEWCSDTERCIPVWTAVLCLLPAAVRWLPGRKCSWKSSSWEIPGESSHRSFSPPVPRTSTARKLARWGHMSGFNFWQSHNVQHD